MKGDKLSSKFYWLISSEREFSFKTIFYLIINWCSWMRNFWSWLLRRCWSKFHITQDDLSDEYNFIFRTIKFDVEENFHSFPVSFSCFQVLWVLIADDDDRKITKNLTHNSSMIRISSLLARNFAFIIKFYDNCDSRIIQRIFIHFFRYRNILCGDYRQWKWDEMRNWSINSRFFPGVLLNIN